MQLGTSILPGWIKRKLIQRSPARSFESRGPVPCFERLERRQLFCGVPASVVEPATASTMALVATPAAAASTSSLDGTYNGSADITVDGWKSPSPQNVSVKIDRSGKRARFKIILNKFITFKPVLITTFVKSGKHFWVAHVSEVFGEITIQIEDTGKITIDADFDGPGINNVQFHYQGSRSASSAALPAATLVAKPLAAAPSPLIGNYSGTLSSAGIPHVSYPTTASILQAAGANLKLVTTFTLTGFGSFVGTFVFTPGVGNKFTVNLGKNQAGQTRTLIGKLDKNKNLQLTFFVPPAASLIGTLTRVV